MDTRTRLGWIRLYKEIGNAGIVCRRCGISRGSVHERGGSGIGQKVPQA